MTVTDLPASGAILSPVQEKLTADAAQMMTICNACRYCEGYCAVFPAMERRLEFVWADMSYLANLCHACGECYFACQFAPPHEFGVNIPKVLAEARLESQRDYAWPRSIATAFNRDGIGTALALAACIAGGMILVSLLLGPGAFSITTLDGDFYRLVPHNVMAGTFGIVGLFILVAIIVGGVRAWRDFGEPGREAANVVAWHDALKDAFTLKYLGGDGDGCATSDLRRSQGRRHAHHATFYGFLLCFAATITGTIYHYGFGWKAPYGLLSLPVVLGTLGGIGLLIGPPLLYVLRRRADPAPFDKAHDGIADALIALLFLSSATGLALLALRSTGAMAVLLIVHLAVVMALFLTIPYGKFIHSLYRLLALVKFSIERRRPGPAVGGEG